MTTTTGITPEARKLLRAPFAASAVKWVPIGGLLSDGNAVLLQPHINASLVFERLSEVDPSWTHDTVPMISNTTDPGDPFGLKHGSPWKCTMTLLGVTRPGIGQLKAGAAPSNMHLKTAYSDAVKRAALEFELGAYLRAIDVVYLERQTRDGELYKFSMYQNKPQFKGLTKVGKRVLAKKYTEFITNPEFVARYGDAIEYGDVAAIEEDDVEAAPELEMSVQVNDTEADVLILLAGYNGRNTTEDVVRETLKTKPFARCLPQMMNSVASNLACSTTDAERLRKLAITAATGDEKAFSELGDGLGQLQSFHDAEVGESE